MIWILLILVLLYTNVIRFLELKHFTHVYTFKDYWNIYGGGVTFMYNLTITCLILLSYYLFK